MTYGFTLWFQVFHYKGFLYRLSDDLLLCFWCPCFLAHTPLLLDCSFCPYNEAPNHAHDQVQVCSIQHWKAGESSTLPYFILNDFLPSPKSIWNCVCGLVSRCFLLRVVMFSFCNCNLLTRFLGLLQRYVGKPAASSSGSADWRLGKQNGKKCSVQMFLVILNTFLVNSCKVIDMSIFASY